MLAIPCAAHRELLGIRGGLGHKRSVAKRSHVDPARESSRATTYRELPEDQLFESWVHQDMHAYFWCALSCVYAIQGDEMGDRSERGKSSLHSGEGCESVEWNGVGGGEVFPATSEMGWVM